MEKSTKIIVGLLLALAAVSWYAVRMYRTSMNKKESPIEKIVKTKIQTEAKAIAKEVDKNGLEHTVLKMAKEIDRDALDKVTADLLDTIAQLNIEREKLKQVTVIATNLSIKNEQLKKAVGFMSTVYTHKDDHFNLSVNIPFDSTKNATFDAGYDADLITTQYSKGNWFSGYSSYMDIYSNDRRFTIKGAKTLTVKQNTRKFGIHIQASGTYHPVDGLYSFGPSARIDIGRFNVQGNYSWSPSHGKWYPSISGAFDIARF